MNWLNHFIFAISLSLIFVELNFINLIFVIVFSLLFGVLIDLDHKFNRRAPWYHKRTWIQEPLGFVLVGLPLALVLSLINKNFFILVLVPYFSQTLLDYLCVYEAYPLAPFSKIKKKEGWGLFIPDNLLVKSENSRKWAERIKVKKIKGISENYFTIFNLILFITILSFKLNIF